MLAGESEISKIIKMNLLSSETVKRWYGIFQQNENRFVTTGKPLNK